MRVSILLLAVACVGIIDLLLTLTFVTSVGMIELNPLARGLMRLGDMLGLPHSSSTVGVVAVVLWKLLTLSVAIGILYRFRKMRLSEIATWSCFAVSIALSVRWMWFVAGVAHIAPEYHEINLAADPRYVVVAD